MRALVTRKVQVTEPDDSPRCSHCNSGRRSDVISFIRSARSMRPIWRSLRKHSEKKSILRSHILRAFFSVVTLTASVGIACGEEAAFYTQCHKLLPSVDEFARTCLDRARSFSRTFYHSGGSRGEEETYSTYFQPLDAPSHFVLGCVLDHKHKINFAGLYYTARPLNMARFGDYDIVFIDPNDNVGLKIDDRQNTLMAVRQFVTGFVPPRLTGRPKNCEDPHIETIGNEIATAHERFRQIDLKQFEWCSGTACRTAPYITLLGAHSAPIIYAHDDVILIDAGGALMIREDFYNSVCSAKRGDAAGMFNIMFEMCAQQPK
jgi:hypothetical protein